MDQVSRPLLIAFAATIALVAFWLVALRPKPVAIDTTPLGPTQAVAPAKQASVAANAATAKVEAAANAAGEPAAPAASATKPAPAASAAKPAPASPATATAAKPASKSSAAEPNRDDAAVLRDIRSGKVVVMLFWDTRSADDVATRGAIRELDRRGGKVAVHVVPIGRVGRYESITQGVTVAQSPTTLVIGAKSRTRSIVGLTEEQELSQAVSDALAGR